MTPHDTVMLLLVDAPDGYWRTLPNDDWAWDRRYVLAESHGVSPEDCRAYADGWKRFESCRVVGR